jgi:hypothetical protein
MKYQVKTRYRTFYDGDDLEQAYQVYSTMKKGGRTDVRMTPDHIAKGFVNGFKLSKNKLIFSNEYAAHLAYKHLKKFQDVIKLRGKEIVVLKEKFLSKIVYLTEELFKNSAEISNLAKNKLGITNDVKKYRVRLEGGEEKQIFAYSIAEARAEAKKVTDKKIQQVKELSNG